MMTTTSRSSLLPKVTYDSFDSTFTCYVLIVNWLLLKLLESNLSSITSLIQVILPFFYHSLGFIFELFI